MNAYAPDTEKLIELDAGMRRAWVAYKQGLHDLTGDEYELAEAESWEKLQRELRRLERRRKMLHGVA